MANTAANAAAGITGAVAVDPTNTATAPTGTASTLTGFDELGYIGEDGVTEARSRSIDAKRAWQNGEIVRTIYTEGELTYHFVALETNLTVIESYYGTSVTQAVADGSWVIDPTATGGRKRWVITVVDGGEIERTYIPQGEITEVGDKVYQNGELIGYEMTLTAYKDSGIGGHAKVWNTRLKSA